MKFSLLLSSLMVLACKVIGAPAASAAHPPGAVVAWGSDVRGQLSIPSNLGKVVKISAGYAHNLALTEQGQLVTWGWNSLGQGLTPSNLPPVVDMAAGYGHNVVLLHDSTVFAWGANYAGQTNVPAGLSNVVTVAAGWDHNLALKADGTVVSWGLNDDGQTNVPAGLSNVVSIAAGSAHSIAKLADGSVVAWGQNTFGQGSVPTHLTNILSITAGSLHNVAIQSDGSIVAWGQNYYGQLLVPEGLKAVAVDSGYFDNLAIKPDGTVAAWPDAFPNTRIPSDLRGVVEVQSGYEHGIALIGPVISRHPDPQTVIVGNSTVLRVAVVDPTPTRIQWYRDDTLLTNETNAVLNLAAVQAEDNGNYRAIVTGINGTISSREALITVLEPPLIVGALQDTQVVLGGTANFEVSATGTAPFSFQWLFNGQPLTDQTNRTLQISLVQAVHQGGYSVIVTNVAGAVTSTPPAQLSIVFPPTITVQPQDKTVIGGTDVELSVTVIGTGPFTYQWQRDGEDLPNENQGTLLLRKVQTNQSGAYRVIVTNAAGTSTSAEARLTVSEPIIIVQQPTGGTFSLGNEVNLSVQASGPQLSYQWLLNGVELPGETNSTLTLVSSSPTDAGAYTVRVTNPGGSVLSRPANLLFFGEIRAAYVMTLAGPTGQRFRVEFAESVGQTELNWQFLTNITLQVSPTFVLDDYTIQGKRFYRAIPLPDQ